MMIKGLGDEQALDAASKELGVERDRLKAELEKEPPASNIVVHPAAVPGSLKACSSRGTICIQPRPSGNCSCMTCTIGAICISLSVKSWRPSPYPAMRKGACAPRWPLSWIISPWKGATPWGPSKW